MNQNRGWASVIRHPLGVAVVVAAAILIRCFNNLKLVVRIYTFVKCVKWAAFWMLWGYGNAVRLGGLPPNKHVQAHTQTCMDTPLKVLLAQEKTDLRQGWLQLLWKNVEYQGSDHLGNRGDRIESILQEADCTGRPTWPTQPNENIHRIVRCPQCRSPLIISWYVLTQPNFAKCLYK